MKITSITNYLKPYLIARRWTTFNGAIQHALALHDEHDDKKIKQLLKVLGQSEDEDLKCIYCKKPATSWDHLYSNVKDSKHSGYGNRIFNLVPACTPCNVSKRNKHWKDFIRDNKYKSEITKKLSRLDKLIGPNINTWEHVTAKCPELALQYEKAINKLKSDIKKMDKIAEQIRELMK